MESILFLTTANLPTNPRLLKEIDNLSVDYTVTVLLFKLGNWSDALDDQMRTERQHIHFITLDATRKKILPWIVWAMAEKGARIAYPFFKKHLKIIALANSRRALQLHTQALKLQKPDTIIAHTLGALYPTYCLSQKWGIPFVYDIEDYDPGIYVPQAGMHYIPLCEQLLKQCLPHAQRLTSASPLIGEYTLNLIGGHSNHSVILNSFWSSEFIEPKSKIDGIALKFVWFSQKISFGRGLEQFFSAIKKLTKLNSNIEVTLIGDLDLQFKVEWIETMSEFTERNSWFSIQQIHAMPQKELHVLLADFDIGLAIEPGKDLNNSLAISNKIIAYAQAGLYIMATNTPAQKQFIEEDNARGIVCGQTDDEMATAIQQLVASKNKIRSESMTRFEKGKELAYDKVLTNNRI